jgi:hypothetical protein
LFGRRGWFREKLARLNFRPEGEHVSPRFGEGAIVSFVDEFGDLVKRAAAVAETENFRPETIGNDPPRRISSRKKTRAFSGRFQEFPAVG